MMINKEKLNGKLSSGSREELTPTLEEVSSNNAPQTIVQMRDGMGWPAKDITRHELVIEDNIIKGHIPVRIYRKKSLRNTDIPVLVYLHGGGFFGGSIHNVEQICRAFADRNDMAVVSVGYRLSPEHPFPAGLMDCYKVVETLAGESQVFNVQAGNIYVSGDSAGGNLSLTTAILDTSIFETNYIKKIVSYYPVVDLTSKGEGEFWKTEKIAIQTEQEKQLITDYINGFAKLEAQVEDWYCGFSVDRSKSLISPYYATSQELSKLPPIKIIIGEFDPLRLQVEALAEKLNESSNRYSLSIYSGMIHAFMDKIGIYDEAERGIMEAVEFLKEDN